MLTSTSRCFVGKFAPLINAATRKITQPYQKVIYHCPKRLFFGQQLLCSKIFNDRENRHAYEILTKVACNNMCREQNIEFKIKDFTNEMLPTSFSDTKEAIKALQTVVEYCRQMEMNISEEKFDVFVDSFCDICDKFDIDQIIKSLQLLQLLPEVEGVNSRNFVELWKALDNVCMLRMSEWSVDEILRCSDCWYRLNLGRICEFVWDGVKKIGRKARKLTSVQFAHTMFLCNILRKPPVDMFEFELRFEEIFDRLSATEVGVVCAAFFKTQTKIHSQSLIEKIYKLLMVNLSTVDDITLVNFLKTIRYSSKIPQAELMVELMEQLCTKIPQISLLACLHIALTGCDIQMCHDKCIQLLVERFEREVAEARLKDLERICHVMSLFNVQTETGIEHELCKKVLAELSHRVDEIMQYPKCFQTCLHYLSLCGYHDNELLTVALDPRFIRHIYGNNQFLGREVFCLDSFARINLKDTYTGNLLVDKQRRTMGKLFTHYIPVKNSKFKLTVTDRILVEINEQCRNLYGVSNIKHILPHFERPDVLIVYDTISKRVVPLSQTCPQDYSGKILTRDDVAKYSGGGEKSIETIVIVVGGWNNFVRNTNRLTGLLQMKMEQLQILGHSTVLIPWHEWREQENALDANNYIKRKLSAFL